MSLKFGSRISMSIGFKLIGLMVLLLLGAVSLLTILSVHLFREDNTALVQQLNSHQSASLATEIRVFLRDLLEKTPAVSINTLGPSEQAKVFTQVPELWGAWTLERDSGAAIKILSSVASPALPPAESAKLNRLPSDWLWSSADSAILARSDSTISTDIRLVHWLDGRPALAVLIQSPPESGSRHATLLLVDPNPIRDFLNRSDGTTSYLVDSEGKAILHSDFKIGSNEGAQAKARSAEIAELQRGTLNNRELRYEDAVSHERLLASYHKIGIGGLAVVAETPEAIAFEASYRVVELSVILALIIFCGALFVGSIYSATLVAPILKLTEAAKRIASGDFTAQVEVRGKQRDAELENRDEIVALSHVFNSMALGLQERDRFRETFVKYHSRETAELLLSDEVKLGGEKLDAVILFIDIRGFTSLSEKLEAHQVVETLNDYLSRMVKIIQKRGGVIDKFIGDAIMATWGVPVAAPQDVQRALAACLEIRMELGNLNAMRKDSGKDLLKIGMGLNLGPVIAGNIGSEERMEYTVIGDSVNVASRLESYTKEMGVDLLVSDSIYRESQGSFNFELGPKIKLRGKEQEIQVYQVIDRKPEFATGQVRALKVG